MDVTDRYKVRAPCLSEGVEAEVSGAGVQEEKKGTGWRGEKRMRRDERRAERRIMEDICHNTHTYTNKHRESVSLCNHPSALYQSHVGTHTRTVGGLRTRPCILQQHGKDETNVCQIM